MQWQPKDEFNKNDTAVWQSCIYENKEVCSLDVCRSLQKAKFFHKTGLKVLRDKWEMKMEHFHYAARYLLEGMTRFCFLRGLLVR